MMGWAEMEIHSSLASVATTASERLSCRRHLCFSGTLVRRFSQIYCCTLTKMAPVVVVDSLPTFVSPDVHKEMVEEIGRVRLLC